jgi:hypothetical protein
LEGIGQLPPLENIAIGDFGVAKYEGDNQWYRARLIMCEEQNRIKIVYVDFGNIEVKSIREFYQLHQLFTVLPAQAIAGSLSQVNRNGTNLFKSDSYYSVLGVSKTTNPRRFDLVRRSHATLSRSSR